jgi:hypothetical protein
MCTYVARVGDDYKRHVVQCAMRTFKCTYCSFSSNKELNVKRHERRSHVGLLEDPIKLDGQADKGKEHNPGSSITVESADQSEEEWLKQDYGEVIGTVSSESDDSAGEDDTKDDQHRQEKSPVTEDLLEGRVIRKQTTPAKPCAPRPKSPLSASKADGVHKETECSCRKRKLVSVAVQTDDSKRTVVTNRLNASELETLT